MIIFVTGKSGAGKDVFADILVEELNKLGKDAGKILSYTTRKPRNKEDYNNHTFVQEFNSDGDIVAYTIINNEYYWTERNQFNNVYNVYVIDKPSIKQVMKANMAEGLILGIVLEIQRKDSLIDIPEERKNRKIGNSFLEDMIPFIIENNGTIEELREKARNFIHTFFM